MTMLHEIGVELQAELRAKGCPFPVVDGPERTKTTDFTRQRVVIELVDDAIGLVKSQSLNPKRRAIVVQNCKITIYAQSTRTAAVRWEHERVAHQVRDLVIVAMYQIAADRKNRFVPVRGAFVIPEDMKDVENPAGAAYELAFTFDRAVEERTWKGERPAEHTIGANGMTSVTKVARQGVPDDDDDPNTVPADAETACGEA